VIVLLAVIHRISKGISFDDIVGNYDIIIIRIVYLMFYVCGDCSSFGAFAVLSAARSPMAAIAAARLPLPMMFDRSSQELALSFVPCVCSLVMS
jgi:hypothetical protein